MKINYNECKYSPGTDKHALCTHPGYCIFNPLTIQLENNIHNMETELHQHIKNLEFIKTEGTSNTADYDTTTSRIQTLHDDLDRLKKFKKNIIDEEKYGFIQL